MERVPLSTFTRFMSAGPTRKLAVVKHFKDTQHGSSFYMPLREAIVEVHAKKFHPGVLDHLPHNMTDERKRRTFPRLVEGYRKWLGTRDLRWTAPPHTLLPVGHELEVDIAPDLGFDINGTPHIIQFSFTGFSSTAAQLAIGLMIIAFQARPGTVYGVLDVAGSELHSFRARNSRLGLLARGEAASFLTMYSAI